MAQLNLPPPPTGDDPKGVQFRDWFYKLSQFLKNNVFGTVTSVDVSGGTTGLTTSGGPITSSGTITIAGTLDYTNGGTGLTALGTANQVLATNAGATAIEWQTPSSGSAAENVLTADLTVATDTSYVVVGYLDLNGFNLTVDGNVGII